MRLISAILARPVFRSFWLSMVRFSRACAAFCRQRDKQQHFGLSVFIVLAALPWSGLALAIAISAAAGLAKEVWDHYYGTGFCPYDLLADAAGISVVAFVPLCLM